jgi:hypothetical protein
MKNSALSKSSSHYRREWPHPLKSTSTWRQRRHSFSSSSSSSFFNKQTLHLSTQMETIILQLLLLINTKNKEHKHSILCLSFTICISLRFLSFFLYIFEMELTSNASVNHHLDRVETF